MSDVSIFWTQLADAEPSKQLPEISLLGFLRAWHRPSMRSHFNLIRIAECSDIKLYIHTYTRMYCMYVCMYMYMYVYIYIYM